MKEIWKDIKGYEKLYQVSNLGKVKSLAKNGSLKEKNMKLRQDKDGYFTVGLRNGKVHKWVKIHRLIAVHFIANPLNKKIVCHKNDIKTDNSIKNLYWGSPKENTRDLIVHGNFPDKKGEKSGTAKLNEKQVRVIKHIFNIANRISDKVIGEIFKVSRICIVDIKTGRTWGHIKI